jgi:hypothetical protein
MFSEDRERSRPAAPVTAAGIDHVRLWYHYLDVGDLDAYGSLLDEHAQLSRPDALPGNGREQILERQAQLASSAVKHHIYKIIADDGAVAVMGRYTPPPSTAPRHAGTREINDTDETDDADEVEEVEFADFFTLTDKGLLLTCRRYYFVAP